MTLDYLISAYFITIFIVALPVIIIKGLFDLFEKFFIKK